MNTLRRGSLLVISAASFLLLAKLAAAALGRAEGETSSHSPTYTADGQLQAPTGYRSWVFVGTDLSPRYKPEDSETRPTSPEKSPQRRKEDDTFHTVYINPESYDAFLKTGQFPDPTILMMEVFKAEERDPGGVLASGQFQGKRIGVEAAVKDSKRPGGGVPWAYYDFAFDKAAGTFKPSRAKPDRDCYDCHRRHASKDNVWVQFYPSLRDPQ